MYSEYSVIHLCKYSNFEKFLPDQQLIKSQGELIGYLEKPVIQLDGSALLHCLLRIMPIYESYVQLFGKALVNSLI